MTWSANVPPAPATEPRPVKETLHGVEVVDEYRWLEGDAKGNVTPEVAAWTDAQNARTRAVLDNLPGRDKVEARFRELLEVTSVSAPSMADSRYFHRKREGKQNQSVLYVRQGHDGESRVLLDPNRLDEKGLVTLSFATPNHDGTLLAFGTYKSGDENSVCNVLEVETGKWLGDEVSGKVSGVKWTPDSKGFFYEKLADVKNPYSAQIRYHRLGTPADSDPVLFEQYKEGPLATTWGPGMSVSRDARWGILSYWTGTKSNDLWVADLDLWFRTGEFKPVEIVKGKDAIFGGPINGDTLYMQTTLDAPNGRVIAVELHRPQQEHWKEVVAERKDAVLEDVSLARGILVLGYQKNASSAIELRDLDGENPRPLELPGIGSAGLSTEQDRTEAYLTYTSFNYPPTIFRVDLRDGGRALWDEPKIPVDPSIAEVKQVWYTSRDGTKVSMFVVHKKGLVLDGNNPTMLTGYGGFGLGRSPSFGSTLFPWFEAGGVYAVPNLRGGNEYGDQWHAGGMLERKQNVFDDFIAAAEWLVENKYTRPERIGIAGGSNGGLLTGAAVVQRPDLFAAAISSVPLLDMIRYQDFLMARYWVPEYGSSEVAAQFEYLMKYSPYHNIRKGVKYPAVFLTAGENDTRVHPMHARKMAAKLQWASASDEQKRPILLWVERDAGHGGGKPLSMILRDITDARMFLMWQLGMLDGAAAKSE